MLKIYKVFLVLFFLNLPHIVIAHVQHYENLKIIEFDIYRNNKHIGEHVFSFKKNNDELTVISAISFEIKKLGIVIYKYKADGIEVFKDGKLVKFNSTTNQNKKIKYVNMKLENNEYIIDGSSYKGKVPLEYMLGTWWNHSLVKAPAQISAISGRIINQKVTFLGKERVVFGNKTFDTLHFNFSSTDKNLKEGKRLNTDVWYDEKTLNWVKASFQKKGNWEYILRNVE